MSLYADSTGMGGALPMGGEIVDKQTLQFRRAFRDEKEAYEVFKRVEVENRDRNYKAAAIMKKFNDEAPWNAEKLKAAGQGWRHNRSTGFMSSLVRRMIVPYKQAIDSAKYLTMSYIEGISPEIEQKNNHFREMLTKTVRRWNGWNNFTYQICLENVLFGYTAACWTDEWDWRPIFCRQDEVLFPDSCPQDANDIPFFCKRQNFYIHQLADYLIEPEVSKQAGWNIENVVEAVNSARPEQRRVGTYENIRKFEDTVRESTIGRSFVIGVKVIEAVHVIVKEVTGKVSHYILNARNGKELFVRLDRFDSMEDCIATFTVEVGNGKIHGSKGAGRQLYNTHVAIEQSRNLIADNLYMSGLLLLKSSNRARPKVPIQVIHPMCVIDEAYEVIDQRVTVDKDAFFALDRHMSQIAELQVGAFLPSQNLDEGGKKRTASEVNYVASIEQQIRDGVLRRFYGQFSLMMTQIQKRIFSAENIMRAMQIVDAEKRTGVKSISGKMRMFMEAIGKDASRTPVTDTETVTNADALEACCELLRRELTPEDIFQLATCPAGEVFADRTAEFTQNIAQVVAGYSGNPMVNQQELVKKHISSLIGFDEANALVIPQDDSTVSNEAIRMQLLELQAMSNGDVIPVSPRDNHSIHLEVMLNKVAGIMQTIQQGGVMSMMPIISNLLGHYDGHLQAAEATGMKGDALEKYKQFSELAHKEFDRAQQVMGQMPQNGLQAPAGAQPMAAVGMPEPQGAGAMDAPTQTDMVNTMQTIAPRPVPPSESMPLSKGPINMQPKIA